MLTDCKFGVTDARSLAFIIRCDFKVSPDNAVTETGTSCKRSSRRCAVTTMSSTAPEETSVSCPKAVVGKVNAADANSAAVIRPLLIIIPPNYLDVQRMRVNIIAYAYEYIPYAYGIVKEEVFEQRFRR